MGRCQATEKTAEKIHRVVLSGHIRSIPTFLSGGGERIPSSGSSLKDLSVQLPVRGRYHRLPELTNGQLNNKSGLPQKDRPLLLLFAAQGTG